MGVCDACGNDKAYVSMGDALLCRLCAVDVGEEIDRLRAAGQPVAAVKIARRMYRESHEESRITIDLQPEIIDKLDSMAKSKGISRSDMAAEVIKREVTG